MSVQSHRSELLAVERVSSVFSMTGFAGASFLLLAALLALLA
jgi:hypothetical protein